jgi:cytochrome c oxidase assembly factor CtaG
MRPLRILAVASAAALAASPALAHGGATHAPTFGWTLDPWILAPLALALTAFSVGWSRLRGRTRRGGAGLMRRALLFAAGWGVLALALVTPLHAAGERSFAAHMFEHELLMLAAAPLLVLSEPLAVMLWSLPGGGRRALGAAARMPWLAALWRALTEPVTATLIQAAALWLWHAPALFDLALAGDGWHVAQHLTFLVSALLFWSAVLRGRRRSHGVAALCLFATSVVSGALGALMAFSQSPWYAGYSRLGMAPFGLTPMEDQQLAGVLMWIPGGVVHAAAALAMVAAALRGAPGAGGAIHAPRA